jgi:hypothetical protein
MSEPTPHEEPDPSEVEPTDNSTGALVDLDRVREIEEQDPPTPTA